MSKTQSALERVTRLDIWRGPVSPEPLGGGITNVNFTVEDHGNRYVVRVGNDIPVHQVMRFNEHAASRAAAAAGLSPAVVHTEPGILVLEFIRGKTLSPGDIRDAAMLARVLELVRCCHDHMPGYVRGPVLMFWVFHVLRDYAHSIEAAASPHAARVPQLMATATRLERHVGAIDVVFGHNDLLAANFIDDGQRLWLIDWDYAGFGSPLFDLANLASNNDLSPPQEDELLTAYFGAPPDDDMWRRYGAMKCASLLRETMWSMVSEIHSSIDFDFAAYTADNLARFDQALASFTTRFEDIP